MIKYIKTSAEPNVVLPLLVSELKDNKNTVVLTSVVILELEKTYKVNLNSVLACLIRNIRLGEVKKDILQAYILNQNIGKSNINEIINFIDYGTLDIKGTMAITDYVNRSIYSLKERLGGI